MCPRRRSGARGRKKKRTMKTMADFLLERGCKTWEGRGEVRIYISRDLAIEAAGLSIAYNGRGNVRLAFQHGKKIANSGAAWILQNLGRTYYRPSDDTFYDSRHGIADGIYAMYMEEVKNG